MISKDSKMDIIFPLDDFIKAKNILQYPIYFKTDVHITMDGTYILYDVIMRTIKKDFPNLKIFSTSDFRYYYSKKVLAEKNKQFINGSSCNYAAFPQRICDNFLDIDYRYYKHKNSKNLGGSLCSRLLLSQWATSS